MTARRGGPGRWVAATRFRDLDGHTRQVQAGGTSKQGALSALQDRLRDRRMTGGRIGTDTTVTDLMGMWLDQKEASQSTLDAYKGTIARVIVPQIGQMTVSEVTTGAVDVHLERIASVAERKRARTVLSQAFGLAVRWDAVKVNPVRDASPVKDAKRDVTALSVQDLVALRRDIGVWVGGRRARLWLAVAVDVLVGSGIRPGEVLALRWKDLTYTENGALVLSVNGTVKRDSKRGLHRQDHPKSAAGERDLVLPRFAVEALLQHRDRADRTDGDALVFPARGGGPIEPGNFRRLWREVRGETWAHVTPRSFRTAVATLIARQAGSEAGAGQLGHASVAVTEKHYIQKDKILVDNTVHLAELGA